MKFKFELNLKQNTQNLKLKFYILFSSSVPLSKVHHTKMIYYRDNNKIEIMNQQEN